MDAPHTEAARSAESGARRSGLSAMNVPWTSSPLFPRLLADARLESADRTLVEAFARDGYVVVDAGIPDLAEAADRIRVTLGPRCTTEGRVQDAWSTNADVRRLATLPTVDRVLRLLYRREPIPFQTLNFSVGTEQATHSDTLHFHCVPHGFMCGAWLALEDIDETCGPLHVIPGSHTLPVWNLHDIGLPSGSPSYQAYEAWIREYVETVGLRKHVLTLRRGELVLWAANLLHGGEPRQDRERTRYSQVTHYYFSDCLYYTPMLSDPYLGRITLRSVTNIHTGRSVPNVYGGAPLGGALQRLGQRARALFSGRS